MKKTALLAIVFFLYIQPAVSQELPTIIPPSPTAFQMTRYGDVAVNESTGKISPSIPLYTYRAGRLNLPIGLSYQGNGVKVDQSASWTGINWNLNAGGVIARTVRDQDDFNSQGGRRFYSEQNLNEMDIYNNPDNIALLYNFITANTADSEVDIFSFSFPGYSGSFYFDEDFEAHLTKNDSPLKIEVDEGPPIDSDGITQHLKREITITTPEGIKYYFGGLHASEASKTVYPTAGGGATNFVQTAFYLHKMQHPLGDEIYFVYETFPFEYSNLIAVSERISMLVETYTSCLKPDETLPDLGAIDKLRNSIKDGQFLKRIYSNKNSYEVVFSNSTVPISNTDVRPHYLKVLNSMIARNSMNLSEELEKIDFEYLYPKGVENSQRFFLKSVNFNNGTSYKMDYNSPESLPKRFDYDQDHLGYFNNKGNSRFAPKTDNSAFTSIYNSLADKSPKFNYSSKGALIKLTYPTGGYSEFEYESGFLSNETASETKYAHFITYRNDPTRNPSNKNPNFVYLGVLENDRGIGGSENGTVDTIKDQLIDVRLHNVKSIQHLDMHVIFRLTVKDFTDNTEQILNKQHQYGSEILDWDPVLGNVFTYETFIFKGIRFKRGHNYKISLEIVANSVESNGTINANIDFNYEVETEELIEDLGIRIKSVTDYPANKAATRKHYEYLSESTAIIPRYVYSTLTKICCDEPLGAVIEKSLVNLTSSSISSIYTNSNNEKVYSKVLTYMSDVNSENPKKNYINGYIEKEFIVRSDASPFNFLGGVTGSSAILAVDTDYYRLPNKRENKSVVNGLLKKEKIFSKTGGIQNEYRLIKETEYDYTIDSNSTFITNNATTELFTRCEIVGNVSDLGTTYLGLYNTYSNKVQLNSTTTKVFDFGSSTISGSNTSSVDAAKVLETTIEYEYDQYVGLPTKVTTFSSDTDIATETRYTYPSISNDVVSHISKPLFIRSYITNNFGTSSELLSTVQNTYNNNFNHYGQDLKLPSKVKVLKGELTDESFLEDRILYHDYDAYGNPLEVSKADGTHIVYIWGYNQTQPIAKIENATYAQVSSRVANLQTLSNADDDRTVDILNSNGTITKVGKEGDLREALRNLRINFKNSLVTTYTYDPLIGVTSVTDPRGDTVYYDYDPFNRLKHVKDKDGNILSQNQYNYKN